MRADFSFLSDFENKWFFDCFVKPKPVFEIHEPKIRFLIPKPLGGDLVLLSGLPCFFYCLGVLVDSIVWPSILILLSGRPS